MQPTYCSLPAELTTMGSSGVPAFISGRARQLQVSGDVPRRLASRGLMSKMSTPCIFPRISRRSRPVDCSASVGTVPGFAPSGIRSSMDLISGAHQQLAVCPARARWASSELGAKSCGRVTYGRASCSPRGRWGRRQSGQPPSRGWPRASRRLQSSQWCVVRWLPGGPLRRTKVVVKVRRAMAAGAARLAAAMAERWRNMARAIGVEWRGGRGRSSLGKR